MAIQNKQSHVVARWEQLYLQERRAKTEGNRGQADILRSQMALTEVARASSL